MEITAKNTTLIDDYPKLASFIFDLHSAAVYFSDILDIYSYLSYSPSSLNQFSKYNSSYEWVVLASNKMSSQSNGIFLDPDSPFQIFIEDNKATKKCSVIDLDPSLFNETFSELKILINNIPFTLEDAIDYIASFKGKTEKNKKFYPVFNYLLVISDSILFDKNILIPHFIGNENSKPLNPFDLDLNDEMSLFLDNLDEILDSNSISRSFLNIAAIELNGVISIGVYSDKRIIDSILSNQLEYINNLSKLSTSFYDLPEKKSFFIDISRFLCDDMCSIEDKLYSAFGGDIPSEIKSSLCDLKEKINRY